jgi:23S rRNA (uracil1939-C5)-methyltransferase
MKTRISEAEYGGAFHAEANTQMRFVLPGELVETDPLAILEASAARVAAKCPHFGVCGGCDYQHAAYSEQVGIKLDILRGMMAAAGVDGLPEIQVETAEPWEYRNRIRVRVQAVDGVMRFGYNQRGTRDFLPIVVCPISAPLLVRAAEALVGMDSPWLASIAEVEFFASADALQMSVFTRDGRTENFAAFCEAFQALVPELMGAGVMAASAGFGAKEREIWGASGLVQEVLGRRYWVTRGGFFQVNRLLVPRMVELVIDGRAGGLAWDLYAGVGLFSRALAETYETVVAVEAGEPAALDLARKQKKAKDIQALQMETVEFLRRAVLQREKPDLVVMDPPRAGLGAEVCELLGRVGARAMVYVSCDPTTLARDLKMLVDSGYQLDEVRLVDMFPQTFHLETVVFLSK